MFAFREHRQVLNGLRDAFPGLTWEGAWWAGESCLACGEGRRLDNGNLFELLFAMEPTLLIGVLLAYATYSYFGLLGVAIVSFICCIILAISKLFP